MVTQIPKYALVQQYGTYYTVQECILSSGNEDIIILQFNTYQELLQYTIQNNIELPIQDNTEEWQQQQ